MGEKEICDLYFVIETHVTIWEGSPYALGGARGVCTHSPWLTSHSAIFEWGWEAGEWQRPARLVCLAVLGLVCTRASRTRNIFSNISLGGDAIIKDAGAGKYRQARASRWAPVRIPSPGRLLIVSWSGWRVRPPVRPPSLPPPLTREWEIQEKKKNKKFDYADT